jgi:hypothetical protein
MLEAKCDTHTKPQKDLFNIHNVTEFTMKGNIKYTFHQASYVNASEFLYLGFDPGEGAHGVHWVGPGACLEVVASKKILGSNLTVPFR